MRARLRSSASLALLVVFVLGGRLGHASPARSLPPFLAAVTPTYLLEAQLSILNSKNQKKAWKPVWFCNNFDAKGRVVSSPECLAAASKTGHFCAIQNLTDGQWNPATVEQDPTAVSESVSEFVKNSRCQYLLIDIESLNLSDKTKFTAWIGIVSAKLKKKQKRLSIGLAVHAKTDAKGSWQGAEAQDWKALCKPVDELVIMAYDYHYPGATEPGETAPIDWFEKVMRFGIASCPRQKLRLGLAAYGYQWPAKSVITERQAFAPQAILPLWIETQEKREQKIARAKKYRIRKFFLWALGMEKLPSSK